MRRQSLNGGCDRSWSSVFAVMITSSVEDVSRQNSQLLNFGGKAQSFLSFIQINVSTGSHIYSTYVCRFRTEFIFGRAKIQESLACLSSVPLLSVHHKECTKSRNHGGERRSSIVSREEAQSNSKTTYLFNSCWLCVVGRSCKNDFRHGVGVVLVKNQGREHSSSNQSIDDVLLRSLKPIAIFSFSG